MSNRTRLLALTLWCWYRGDVHYGKRQHADFGNRTFIQLGRAFLTVFISTLSSDEGLKHKALVITTR
ncbi:hypothetical protein [Vibrio taketomensis]|uniref:hypothetical protein n=1 Tax=Vibrio taketomensis TaxID=2572923 RepID=UPI00138946BE|nr:hypothetical protein [Vibrio taketomensis]